MQRTALRGVLTALCLLAAHCGRPARSLVPAGYQTSFVRVRDCRPTVEHAESDVSHITVFINPESAAAYLADAAELPLGTVIIKEEHDSATCDQVAARSVMRKEPGTDGGRGVWRWQRLNARGTVLEDGPVRRCVTCHSRCQARDWACTDP